MSSALTAPFDALIESAATGELQVGAEWAGFGGLHGGLLLAAAARAMAATLPEPAPLRSVQAEYRGAVAPGAFQALPVLERAGRSVAFTGAELHQGGRVRTIAQAVFGPATPGLDYDRSPRAKAPPVPGPDACRPYLVADGPGLRTVEFRPAEWVLPLTAEREQAQLQVWVRIAGDETPLDAARALVLLDAPAPGLFATRRTFVPIPTVQLSAQLLPALSVSSSPWALARMQTVHAGDGYAIDDCELWDAEGRPIALSRQLRRVLLA